MIEVGSHGKWLKREVLLETPVLFAGRHWNGLRLLPAFLFDKERSKKERTNRLPKQEGGGGGGGVGQRLRLEEDVSMFFVQRS